MLVQIHQETVGIQEGTIAESQFLSNYISHKPTELGVTWVVEREQDGEADELGGHGS